MLVALAACGPVRAAGPTPTASSLRVMTYNIFAGNDLERRSNLTRIAALIDSLGIDVVLLQEVDRGTARSGGVDQLSLLAELTRMHAIFGRSFDFDGGEYGNGILSRWPIRSSVVVPLDVTAAAGSGLPPREPRSLLHAEVATPAGPVHLLATHLDHGAEPAWRHAQQLQLLAHVATDVPRDRPIVLGGDLNARPDTPEVRALALAFTDSWPACGSGDGHTFRSDRPDRRIDYVMLAGARCSRAWVHDTELSDHRPLIVDVLIGGRPRRER